MRDMLEELMKYFETTSHEQIMEDWAKSEKFDQILPTVSDFLVQTQYCIQLYDEIPSQFFEFENIEYSPKFTSGFFLPNYKTFYYARSSIFNSQLQI